jgi:metal-responsive CopG/Arc/MetJ family transcriptional regulator
MSTIKTAVSIDEQLLQEVDQVAKELNLSRSSVVKRAIGEFLKKRRQKQLLEQINQAYADWPDADEAAQAGHFKKLQRKIAERES